MQKIVTSIILMCLLILNGCSLFRGSNEVITVTTNVPDAVIYVNTVPIGKSPASTSVQRNRVLKVSARKKGYDTTERDIEYHLNLTGAADIVGTVIFILPAIGLISPGIYSLDETEIYLFLNEAQN